MNETFDAINRRNWPLPCVSFYLRSIESHRNPLKIEWRRARIPDEYGVTKTKRIHYPRKMKRINHNQSRVCGASARSMQLMLTTFTNSFFLFGFPLCKQNPTWMRKSDLLFFASYWNSACIRHRSTHAFRFRPPPHARQLFRILFLNFSSGRFKFAAIKLKRKISKNDRMKKSK